MAIFFAAKTKFVPAWIFSKYFFLNIKFFDSNKLHCDIKDILCSSSKSDTGNRVTSFVVNIKRSVSSIWNMSH